MQVALAVTVSSIASEDVRQRTSCRAMFQVPGFGDSAELS